MYTANRFATPGVCLRPGVYCFSSPVYPRRVIETGIYSKPACIQENTVRIHKNHFCTHEIMEVCGFTLVARLGRGVASLLPTLPTKADAAILAFW